MNQTLKLLSFSIMAFSIGACFPPATQTPLPDGKTEPVRTADEYEERKQRDKDRDEILKNIRESYKGETCEELKGKDCQEQCDKMYETRSDRKDCEKEKVSFIEDLFEVYESLKDANDFDEIDTNLFKAYISLSISGLDHIIDDYIGKEAEKFLLWLLDDPKGAAKVFIDEDDDHKMLESLFKKIDNNYNKATLYTTFTENIDNAELMEIAIAAGESIVEWFMDYINEKNPSCDSNQETKECFKIYCKIGDDLKKEAREEWSDYEQFENYLEDIVEEKVNSRNAPSNDSKKYNANGWRYGDNHIKELGDLNEDWVEELCQNLK